MRRLNPRDIVIVDAVRTAITKANNGFFQHLSPTDLASAVIHPLVKRDEISSIDGVIFNSVYPELARKAILQVGLAPQTLGQTTGLQALQSAILQIATQQGQSFIVGDVSQAQTLNYQSADLLARMHQISRLEQDEFSVQSHQRAWQATQSGLFSSHIVPVTGHLPNGFLHVAEQDELIQANASLEAFSKSDVLHYGTATHTNTASSAVGASAMLVMSAEHAKTLNLKPRAVIKAIACTAHDPALAGYAMVTSTQKALQLANLKLKQIQQFDFFESSASDVLSTLKVLSLKPEQVNLYGGALALGYTQAPTQSLNVLLNILEHQNTNMGLMAMATPLGEGLSVIIERV